MVFWFYLAAFLSFTIGFFDSFCSGSSINSFCYLLITFLAESFSIFTFSNLSPTLPWSEKSMMPAISFKNIKYGMQSHKQYVARLFSDDPIHQHTARRAAPFFAIHFLIKQSS